MKRDIEQERINLLLMIEEKIDPQLLKNLSTLPTPPQQKAIKVVITAEGSSNARS